MKLKSRAAYVIIIIAITVSALVSIPANADAAIKAGSYAAIFSPFHDKDGGILIAIRSFTVDGGAKKVLAVDPNTFAASIIDAPAKARMTDKKKVSAAPYVRALQKHTASDDKIQNSGIIKGEKSGGIFLTADLCPSKRPLERGLFASSIEYNRTGNAPIALAVSGLWIERHQVELAWIRSLIKEGQIDVTWVNHSYSHPYDSDKPLNENFLLSKGVIFKSEVLKNEILMIDNGIVPSPFFRFPGLVSNDRLLKELQAVSLIPVGSNAWLAKDEPVAEGSIILVHGNGNEPEGIRRLVKFYGDKAGRHDDGETKDTNGSEMKRALKLLPLRDAFE